MVGQPPCQGLPRSQITKVDVHAAGEVTPGGLKLWPVQPSLRNKERGGVHAELRAESASSPWRNTCSAHVIIKTKVLTYCRNFQPMVWGQAPSRCPEDTVAWN